MVTAQAAIQDTTSQVPTAFLALPQSAVPLHAQLAQVLIPALAAKALLICSPASIYALRIAQLDM